MNGNGIKKSEKLREFFIEVEGDRIFVLAKTKKKAMSDFFRMGHVVTYGDIMEEDNKRTNST